MDSLLFWLSFFLVLTVACAKKPNYRVIKTKSGQVRGVQETSFLKHVDFYAFRGIPYAKPPIADLRFKAPEPVEPWSPKVRDAFEYGDTCVRVDPPPMNDSLPQSEDCLFLNIFVPANKKPDKKFAVMFWIHGGGFNVWSGNDFLFGPDFFIEQNVIVVTINYRLGAMGFMSLGTPEYSGNMGLKDQQMALKWVHENIERFSGDKKRITIFGESAGGWGIHYQVLSSESRKYFHNAIAMSGTAEMFLSYTDEDEMISQAYKIAEELDGPKSSLEDLIEFFQNVPAKDTLNYTMAPMDHKTRGKAFLPIIERKDAVRPIIVKTPTEVYQTENIDKDVVFYLTSSEMLQTYEIWAKLFDIYDINKNFSIQLPFRGFNFSFESDEYLTLAKDLREFYFGNATIDEKMKDRNLDMLNDRYLTYSTQKSIRLHQAHTKASAYYIQFSVDSLLNINKRPYNISAPGATHCDEVCYMFRGKFCKQYYDEMLENKDSEQSQISLQAIENITKLFANFAKDNASFKRITSSDGSMGSNCLRQNDKHFTVLDINNNGMQLVQKSSDTYRFWRQLEDKANIMIENRAKQIS